MFVWKERGRERAGKSFEDVNVLVQLRAPDKGDHRASSTACSSG